MPVGVGVSKSVQVDVTTYTCGACRTDTFIDTKAQALDHGSGFLGCCVLFVFLLFGVCVLSKVLQSSDTYLISYKTGVKKKCLYPTTIGTHTHTHTHTMEPNLQQKTRNDCSQRETRAKTAANVLHELRPILASAPAWLVSIFPTVGGASL